MNTPDPTAQLDLLKHNDLIAQVLSGSITSPWFSVYRHTQNGMAGITYSCALVPVNSIPGFLKTTDHDMNAADCGPGIWTDFEDGKPKTSTYQQFGNTDGIEPLAFLRTFHGVRPAFWELAQEFRLYHSMYPEHNRKHLLTFDDNGDPVEAARYGDDFIEVKTDLLLQFLAVKQMALAVFVFSTRYSALSLSEMGISEVRESKFGASYAYKLLITDENFPGQDFKTISIFHGKWYIRHGPMPSIDDKKAEHFQEFVIGEDASGNPVRHTCDPDTLADYFGKNPDAPHYLTPVFFRSQVLTKYYAEPNKYRVADGQLTCGHLWSVEVDNDHADYVVIFLGDIGEKLSESERNYWLSYNIAPGGRQISDTNLKRSFLAEFANPSRADLLFKHEYETFNDNFLTAHDFKFFLPLHDDDSHFFNSLRMLASDNQAEFDSQLLALTKVLVDSLNEKDISKGLKTLVAQDKGINKLEKFFTENGKAGFEPHIKFLRVLQDLRSKSAAHRKGSSYEALIASLQIADDGQQRVYEKLLMDAVKFLEYLRLNFVPPLPA